MDILAPSEVGGLPGGSRWGPRRRHAPAAAIGPQGEPHAPERQALPAGAPAPHERSERDPRSTRCHTKILTHPLVSTKHTIGSGDACDRHAPWHMRAGRCRLPPDRFGPGGRRRVEPMAQRVSRVVDKTVAQQKENSRQAPVALWHADARAPPARFQTAGGDSSATIASRPSAICCTVGRAAGSAAQHACASCAKATGVEPWNRGRRPWSRTRAATWSAGTPAVLHREGGEHYAVRSKAGRTHVEPLLALWPLSTQSQQQRVS